MVQIETTLLFGKDVYIYYIYIFVFEGILVLFGLYFQEVHQHDNKNADFVPCLNAISAKLGTESSWPLMDRQRKLVKLFKLKLAIFC